MIHAAALWAEHPWGQDLSPWRRRPLREPSDGDVDLVSDGGDSEFGGSTLPVGRSSRPDVGDHEGAGLVPVLMGATYGGVEDKNSTPVPRQNV